MISNERIKERRKELGYTLKEIADKLGVAESTAQRYESKNGIKNIPLDILVKYATILSTTPNYLLGWKDDPEDFAVATLPDILYDPDNMATGKEMALMIEKNALSDDELKVIKAYRNASEDTKTAVCKILDIGRD